tara:strand:+ start:293 stop:514 length:222 start_codon:yes stop_codon:yes gene_type:complete
VVEVVVTHLILAVVAVEAVEVLVDTEHLIQIHVPLESDYLIIVLIQLPLVQAEQVEALRALWEIQLLETFLQF